MTELHDLVCQNDSDRLEDEIKKGKHDLNARDEEWGYRAAIHWAASKGFSECIKLLVQNGSAPFAKDYRGWTAAHFAAETGKIASCRVLYTLCSPLDHKDKYGYKPSDVARVYGHKECAKYLKQCESEIAKKRVKHESKKSQKTGAQLSPVFEFDKDDPDWKTFVNIEWGNPEFDGAQANVYIPYIMTGA